MLLVNHQTTGSKATVNRNPLAAIFFFHDSGMKEIMHARRNNLDVERINAVKQPADVGQQEPKNTCASSETQLFSGRQLENERASSAWHLPLGRKKGGMPLW